MKRGIAVVVTALLGLSLVACSQPADDGGQEAATQENVQSEGTSITPSPDKYTWYVKDYVGMNAASVGYEALDGFRRDTYGAGVMKIVFVSADGSYVDPSNEDQLKDYVVTAQNLEPNTEIKYTFQVDSEGEEYDNLLDFQNIEEIVLAVSKVGEDAQTPTLTSINSSPDKYTRFVRDYVGRNLAECGYCSLAGNLTDAYGDGYVVLDIVADDGAFVDPEDTAALASYMVTSQDVEPNTAIQMSYLTDSDGVEYSNLIDTQTIERITLRVTKAPDSGYQVGTEDSDETASDTSLPEDSTSTEEPTDFRAFVDSYEEFMNEYVDFMIEYNDSEDTSGMLTDYATMMTRYAEMAEQVDDIDEESLSADDLAYYTAAMGRITARLEEI